MRQITESHTQPCSLQPPVIIVEGLDVTMYSSVEEAELHLEADIVESYPFTGYDAAGRPLQISTQGDRVVIIPGAFSPAHRERLEASLRECLKAIGWIPPGSTVFSLPELINLGMQAGLSYRDQTRRTPWQFFRELFGKRRRE